MDQKTKRDIISWLMILSGINSLLASRHLANTNRKDPQS